MKRIAMFPDLSRRFDGPEAMDHPDCDSEHLFRTLAQLRWVNLAVSCYRHFLKRWIIADMLRDRSRGYHMVDMGAGGCDIPVWLLAHCRRRGVKLKVTAVDADTRTVAWARARYADVQDLDMVCGSAFDLSGFGNVDYVFSNHFLHHLPDAEIVRLLNGIQSVARRGFLMCDLRRNGFSYLGFSLVARMLLWDSFAFEDGRISIRKGFTLGELQRLIHMSDMPGRSRILRAFPGRLAIVGGLMIGE